MSKTLPKPIPIVLRHHQLTIGREKKQPDFEDKTINNGAIMLMIVYDGFSMDFQLSRTKITTWESTRRRPFMEPKWEPQNPPSGTALKVGRPGSGMGCPTACGNHGISNYLNALWSMFIINKRDDWFLDNHCGPCNFGGLENMFRIAFWKPNVAKEYTGYISGTTLYQGGSSIGKQMWNKHKQTIYKDRSISP